MAGSEFTPNDLLNAFATSGQADVKRLYTAQADVVNCSVTFTHEDATTFELDPARFTIHVSEEIGGDGRTRHMVEGVGFSPTNSGVTLSALS